MNFKLGQKIVIGIWLIQLILSYHAWFGGTHLDVIYFFWYHPVWVPVLASGFIISLIGIAFFYTHQKVLYWVMIGFLVTLLLCNNHLLQPWQLINALLLGALLFENFKLFTLILGGLYFWSGLNKLNPWFEEEVLHWFLSPLSNPTQPWMSIAIPILEMLSGVLLLFNVTQKNAALFCIFKHLFIVIMLSPFVHNWNTVVIPWNIGLAVLLYLFYVKKQTVVIDKPLRIKQYALLFISWIAPLFWYVGLWPFSLSFHLYSGYHSELYLIQKAESNIIDLEEQHQNTYNIPLVINTFTVKQLESRLQLEDDYIALVHYYKKTFEKEKVKVIYQNFEGK